MSYMPDALKTALDFEEKGRNFYHKTAESASDPLSRKLFDALAEDEIKHAQKIRDIYGALTQERSFSMPDTAHQQHLEKNIKDFFESHQARITKETDNVEGYLFAMEMERTGIELYRKFAERAEHEGEKIFYNYLIKEEMEHLEALKNVHFFLTNSEDWLAEDESRHWNWMNS